MNPAVRESLEQRVTKAAESALRSNQFVSPIDVLVEIRRLRHTPYDELLSKGAERSDARELVRNQIHSILQGWATTKAHPY